MKRIINFFRKDIWRKLLALVLAALLYWNLSDREKVTKHFSVPMELELAAGLFLPEDYKLDVRVSEIFSLTPKTTVGKSLPAGAEITTFLAPALI